MKRCGGWFDRSAWRPRHPRSSAGYPSGTFQDEVTYYGSSRYTEVVALFLTQVEKPDHIQKSEFS